MNNTDQANQSLIYKIQQLRKKVSVLVVHSNSLAIYNIAPLFLRAHFIKELFDHTIVKTNAVADINLAMLRDYPDILVVSYLQFVKEKQYDIAVRALILLYVISNDKQNVKGLLTDLYFDDLASMTKLSDIPVSIIFGLIGIKS
ncbi:hypothetical protein NRF22_06335 [Oenococcus kitaharae]|nr:hypothetical protein [Oenococcus kitaharae]MCV3296732.1 hypothetical protein [Oenococcus kitaharae]